MSQRLFPLILIAGVLAGLALFAITPTVSPTPTAVADGDGDDHEVIEEGMEKLNKGFRGLRKAGSDYVKVIELAMMMQEGAMMAKGETPETVAELAEKKQPMALKKYRTTMIGLLQELLSLEAAALAEDAGKVKASIQKLRTIQQAGHRDFKPKDEDEGGRGGRRGG